MPHRHASSAASVSVAKTASPGRAKAAAKARATPAKPARAKQSVDDRATQMLREIRARGERLTADIHGLLARIG